MIWNLPRIYRDEGDGGDAPPVGEKPAEGAGGDPAKGQDPPARPTWVSQLPKELQDDPIFHGFPQIGDFAKGHKALADRSSRSIVIPDPKNPDPNEVKAFLSKLQIPEKPEGYELDPALTPGGPTFAKAWATMAQKNGMSKRQAQEGYTFIAGMNQMAVKQAAEAEKARGIAFEKELLEAAGGDKVKADKIKARATRFLQQKIGDPELLKAMGPLIMNSKYILKLASVDEFFDDAPFIQGETGGSSTSKGKGLLSHGSAFKAETGGRG